MTAAREKIDLYQTHKQDYAAGKSPALVDIAPATYLAIDGRGAPGGDAFSAAIGALYGVAFTVKMTRKFAGEQDYAVCKLEAQWGDDAAGVDVPADRDQWPWRLLIRMPDFVDARELERASGVLLKRGKGAGVDRVRLERVSEGLCVQALHVGPYDAESCTLAAIEAYAASKQLVFAGRRHEIYLSDPRRIPPARLKTILRHPVRPA
jgi:hypothetical protein